MKGIAGKVALVTGGTGLIGGAIARRLAVEGATVFVASRFRTKVEDWIAAADPDRACQFEPVVLDLADGRMVKRAIDEIARRFAPPSIFIAAASLRDGLATAPDDLTPEQFGQLFAVDIGGHFVCAREIVHHLKVEDGASFVWLSSVYAQNGVDPRIYPVGMVPTPVQYAATKSGTTGLVRYLAAAWAGRGVRVNAVVAGGVEAAARQPGDFAARYSAKTMIGRLGRPEEIAAAVAFLASDEASYVTGVCLEVDGGFSAW